MDAAILKLQREIALDGTSGCDWWRFWFLVDMLLDHERKAKEKNGGAGLGAKFLIPDKPEEIAAKASNEKFRRYFWSLLTPIKTFTLKRNTKPTVSKREPGSAPPSPPSWKQLSVCGTIPTTQLEPMEREGLTYDMITQEHTHHIRIVATEAYLTSVMNEYTGNLPLITGNSLLAFQLVTASRDQGVTQAQLSKDMNLDSRSVFYSIKRLVEFKVVVKLPVTSGGAYTLLVLNQEYKHLNLAFQSLGANGKDVNDPMASKDRVKVPASTADGHRFVGVIENEKEDVNIFLPVIRRRVLAILVRAKNYAMLTDDLLDALGLHDVDSGQRRWFTRVLFRMGRTSHVELFDLEGPDGRTRRGIRVGASISAQNALKTKGDDDMMEGEDNVQLGDALAKTASRQGMRMDAPFEDQIFKLIVDSGEQGITAPELRQALGNVTAKLLDRWLKFMIKDGFHATTKIRRVAENVGRWRGYRYFSESAYKTVAKDHSEYVESLQASIGASSTAEKVNKRPGPSVRAKTIKAKAVEPTMAAAAVPVAVDLVSVSRTPDPDADGAPGPSVPKQHVENVALIDSPPTDASAVNNVKPPVLKDYHLSLKTAKSMSSQGLQRRRIVLKIVERQLVVEMSYVLLDLFNEEQLKLDPSATKADRKTVFRSVEQLAAEGEVILSTVANITKVNGAQVSRRYCVRKDLDVNSDQVRDLVYLAVNRAPAKNQGMRMRPTVTSVEVETLEDMKERLGTSVGEEFELPKLNFPSLADSHAQKRAAQAKFSKPMPIDAKELHTALSFGFSTARMLKAKFLHRFMLNMAANEHRVFIPFDGHCEDRNRTIISITPLFSEIPLQLYCRIVGFFRPSAEMEVFLKDNFKSNAPISAMPKTLKPEIQVNMFDARRRIWEVVELMDALGLIEPVELVSLLPVPGTDRPMAEMKKVNRHAKMSHYYRVVTNPAILDFANIEEEVHSSRPRYRIENVAEFELFWQELKIHAIDYEKRVAVVNAPKAPSRKVSRVNWMVRKKQVLARCGFPANWFNEFVITPTQKEILKRYVESHRHYTPVNQLEECKRIAEMSGMTVENVEQFYRRVETRWKASMTLELLEKKKDKALSLSKSEKVRLSRLDSRRTTIKQSAEQQEQEEAAAEARRAERKAQRRAEFGEAYDSAQDESEEESAKKKKKRVPPGHPGGSLTARQQKTWGPVVGRRRRAKRKMWLPKDDEIVKYGEAIMRWRRQGTTFSWQPVADLLDRPTSAPRNRFLSLSKTSDLKARSKILRKQWGELHAHGIATGQIVDVAPYTSLDFDLQSHIAYFKSKEATMTLQTASRKNHIRLPESLEEMAEKYSVVHEPIEPGAKREELSPYQLVNLALCTSDTMNSIVPSDAEIATYGRDYLTSMNKSLLWDQLGVTSLEQELREEHLALAMIKAVFFTRTRSDMLLARALLQKVSRVAYQRACEQAKRLKIMGTIRIGPVGPVGPTYTAETQNATNVSADMDSPEQTWIVGKSAIAETGSAGGGPATMFNLSRLQRSDHFSAIMSGSVTKDMLEHAAETMNEVEQKILFRFNSLAEPGNMLVILDYWAQGILEVNPCRYAELTEDRPVFSWRLEGKHFDQIYKVVMVQVSELVPGKTAALFAPMVPKMGLGSALISEIQENEDEGRSPKRHAGSKPELANVVDEMDGVSEDLEYDPAKFESWEEVQKDTATRWERFRSKSNELYTAKQLETMQAIFESVRDSGAKGATLVEIKREIKNRFGLQPKDAEIRQSVNKLSNQFTGAPILVFVGFMAGRYVIRGHEADWMADYSNVEALESELKFKSVSPRPTQEPLTGFKKKNQDPMSLQTFRKSEHEADILLQIQNQSRLSMPKNLPWLKVPRMWNTVRGEMNQSALDKAMFAVLTSIVDKSGITLSNLERIYQGVLFHMELVDVIEALEAKGSIRLEYGVMPLPATLFSPLASMSNRQRIYKRCTKDTIHERKVTSLFPTSDYLKSTIRGSENLTDVPKIFPTGTRKNKDGSLSLDSTVSSESSSGMSSARSASPLDRRRSSGSRANAIAAAAAASLSRAEKGVKPSVVVAVREEAEESDEDSEDEPLDRSKRVRTK